MGQSADLSLVKTAAEMPTTGGTDAVYSIVVTNNGPGPASGVVVTDTLPSQADFTSVTSDPPAMCVETSGVIVCSIGDLAVGETADIEIRAIVVGAGPVTNTAAVRAGSDNCDPVADNNASSATVTATKGAGPGVNLMISKTDIPDPVAAGEPLTYIIDVFNMGPLDANGTIVSDTLPSGVDFVNATASSGNCIEVSGTVICDLGNILDDTGRTITVTVVPRFAGILVNAASVRSNESEIANPRDNTLVEKTTVTGTPVCDCCPQELANLLITKTASPSPVFLGDPLTFTITVTNQGPSVATNVTVTDPLPPEVSYVSATASQGSVSQAGGTVTALLGTLGVGESATVRIVVTPNQKGTIKNTATANADQAEPAKAKVTLLVVCIPRPEIADLLITKTASPTTVFVGEDVTFTITVTNDGPSSATGVIVTDPLPAGLAHVSSTSSQGFTSFAPNTVTANLGTLLPGQSATVTIVVRAEATGVFLNTATARSNMTDPTPASATVVVTVLDGERIANLGLTKVASVVDAVIGEPFDYILVVINNGPDTATGVTITDVLAEQVEFVSASVTQGSTSVDNTTVTANIGTLGVGASATLTITVNPVTPGLITNTATATANEAEPTTASTEVSVTGQVPPEEMVDLSTTKTVVLNDDNGLNSVKVGELITYNIEVSNAGPAEATNVVVTDVLTTGVVFVSATVSTGTLTHGAGTATFNIPSIAAGATVNITLVVFSKNAGTLVNRVTVTSDEVDSNPDNNDDTATVVVTPLVANLSLTKTPNSGTGTLNEPLVYTLVVTNNGPDSDPSVVITDTLPDGLIFVSGTGTKSTANPIDQTVSVNAVNNKVIIHVGRLNAGDSATIQLTLTPTRAGSITNVANVRGSRGDSKDASATIQVTAPAPPPPAPTPTPTPTPTPVPVPADEANIAVTKTASPTVVDAGGLVTYTILVSNSGPATATNIRVTDILSENSEFISDTVSPGVLISLTGNVINAIVPSLAPGATATITLVVRATGPEGPLTNSVSVIGDQVDPDTSNNIGTAIVQVNRGCCPDLTGAWKMAFETRCDGDSCWISGWLNICNIGNLCPDSDREVFLDIYLSDDGVFSLNDTLLLCIKIQVPKGGECFTFDPVLDVVGIDLTNKWVIAVINPTLGLAECRINNNYVPLQIGAEPQ